MHNGGSGLRLNDGPDVKVINDWLVPNACLWLDPPRINLRFSLALTICESETLFFVSSQCVNLIRLFLCVDTLYLLGSLHATKQFLCFNNNLQNLGRRCGTSKMH